MVGRKMEMVCAQGGTCAHVAPSEGCLCFGCRLEVCLRTWLAAAVFLILWVSLMCICVGLWVKDVGARVLPVWRVCASVGSVWVAWGCLCTHAFTCVLWPVRACGVVHAFQPLLFVVSKGVCVRWCVCTVGLGPL